MPSPIARWVFASLLSLIAYAPVPAPAEAPRRLAQMSAPRPNLPLAFEARASVDDQATTLVVLVSKPVTATAFVLDKPGRIVVDLPEINFQLGGDAGGKAAGLIRSYRFGLFGAGRSRIVIDLAQPATPDVQATSDGASGGTRLVIRLSRVDRAGFAALAARSPQASRPPAAVPAAQTADIRPLVVIDPGHGGVDPGASARNGTQEKTLVFDVARKLREKLAATGRYRILMTRDEDIFVSLSDRVRIARQAQADLLISLHADAIVSHDGVRGASIYTGSERASDAYAASLAESENRADAAAGADIRDDAVDDINDILSDLTRRETRVFAGRFARALVGQLGSAVPMHKTPLRSAGFRVLTAPDVPSVLIELGYLTNPNDIALLTSDEGRARASAAIVGAIDAYFARRSLP